MSQSGIVAVALAAGLIGWGSGAGASGRLGGGVHYLRNLGDVKNDGGVSSASFDKNSVSLLGSVQSGGGLLRLEGQLEYVFNYLGTDEPMWQPSVWILTPGRIYGGGGIGVGYIDGDWQKDPFYALRAGLDLPLAASLCLEPARRTAFTTPTASRDSPPTTSTASPSPPCCGSVSGTSSVRVSAAAGPGSTGRRSPPGPRA
jgi:hypothetical protein